MNFAFKHMDRSEALEKATAESLDSVFDKFSQSPTSINITFSVNKKFQSIHLSAHMTNGNQIELEENSEDIYGAVDGLSTKLHRKLSKIKDQQTQAKKNTEKYDLAEKVNKAEEDDLAE